MTIALNPKNNFIVTGASGNIGRYLIPLLAKDHARVLAIGRDASKLIQLYGRLSNVKVAEYGELSEETSCETLIHLAVLNNNKLGTEQQFTNVNVDFAVQIGREFLRMDGTRFVNLASIQSFDEGIKTHYALSKDRGYKELESLLGERLDNVFIGYFYSSNYFGERFRCLDRFGVAGEYIFRFFKTLKPTTSARLLACYISSSTSSLSPPRILTDDLSRSLIYRSITRSFDLVAAFSVLIGLFPLLAIIWVLIRLDSQGPAIFAQQRVGKCQTQFKLYKFRTMKLDTISAGTHEVGVSAVTRVGRFLRRTKLDELPQAVNLLRGEMTLVGPRPCLPMQDQVIDARNRLGVFAIKPGITGYTQIRGIDMSYPNKLARSDAVYMKLRSLLVDFKIILLTASGRGRGDRIIGSAESSRTEV